ncbi:MAG TPA: metal-sulfur cluster assembly factor [Nitrospiria bacterium]|nr:metal-sulfur cluster assembly factor [Nitrospiria bacterium]
MNEREERVWKALREVQDPELGVNVVDLGLVYGLEILGASVSITMTMTSPACPLNAFFTESIATLIKTNMPELKSVDVRFVWDPPWSPQKMSEEARRQLGWKK